MPSEARSNAIADVGCGIQMQNAMHALLSHKESEIGQYLIYGHLDPNALEKSLRSIPERIAGRLRHPLNYKTGFLTYSAS